MQQHIEARRPGAAMPALHHMTALEANPIELVSIAREVGAPSVCLFLNGPRPSLGFPIVTEAHRRDLTAALRAEGVGVSNLDYFLLLPDTEAHAYRRTFELGASLGGKRVVVLVADDQRTRALERFSELCAEALTFGLGVAVEFMALTPACNSLGKALSFVTDSAAPNAGVGVDILHLTRTGGSPRDLVGVKPGLISHAQICDGPANIAPDQALHEATAERMLPGAGVFPLVDFIKALPQGVDIDVEAPVTSLRTRGIGACERARLAMEGASRLLVAAGR